MKTYRISAKIRESYNVFQVKASERDSFVSLSVELFEYLKSVPNIPFRIFFRVNDEMIEFITPQNFNADRIEQIIMARNKAYDNLDICVLRKDYPIFEGMIEGVRLKKIQQLLEREPDLDQNTLVLFSNLSQASQLIVRGGITQEVARRAEAAIASMIDGLMDCEIAIGTLSRMIIADPTLYDHSASVAMITGALCHGPLKKTKKDARHIASSGLYHDVGKTCVPYGILNKPGLFTAEEYELVKTHTTLGYDELRRVIDSGSINLSEETAIVALEHHEKFCGHGYPQQKYGRREEHDEGIHEFARIVAIADVYSALLMKRVYKEAYDASKALAIMDQDADSDFDPDIWKSFRGLVDRSIQAYDDSHPYVQRRGRILILDNENGRLKIKQSG